MLYVAIWYVSIRYEDEGRTAVLPLVGICHFRSNVQLCVCLYTCVCARLEDVVGSSDTL
jgi:hypothetical protein